ncbi:mitochondrial ribosomal subunit protein-domain-containing protein [Hypoxylon sp. FL1284]|nr:mitochondrial ribosomal subunit protein-domain-containing protein [Hypoxylon sp. FL1284]
MASGIRPMRLCLRALRHTAAPPVRNSGAPIYVAKRAFTTTPTPWRRAAKKDEEEDEPEPEDEGEPMDPAELEAALDAASRDSDIEDATRIQERVYSSTYASLSEAGRLPFNMRPSRSFWSEEEEDPDLIAEEKDEDDSFSEEDIMSMAHGKLEEFREYREYARLAAWEMPLLSKLARPFEPPTAQEPLRFRYTSYMGEYHPAEHKVVVEFSPKDMPLTEAQQSKMRKLLGPRYNPETDVAKISCEQFEHQAQNKRYLGDLVQKLVAQAKDPTDMFEDIPIDTRHHKFKVKPKFPKEWRMTEERRNFIDNTRQKSLLLDQAKEEAGSLISGTEKIEQFFNEARASVRERVGVRLDRFERPLPPRAGLQQFPRRV